MVVGSNPTRATMATTSFMWKKQNPMDKIKKEKHKEYWTWLPYIWIMKDV